MNCEEAEFLMGHLSARMDEIDLVTTETPENPGPEESSGFLLSTE
jgi:hypothetical protein